MRHLMRWCAVGAMLCVVFCTGALAGWMAHAQEDEPLLVLFNYDETRPVLFQPLTGDEEPDSRALAPRITLDANADLPDSLYLAVENTGWSEGAIGMNGADLDPDATYVLLEMWVRLGSRALRDDGRGMIIPLVYADDLSAGAADEPVPGFRLDLLVDRNRIFQLYRVIDEDGGEGRSIWGNQYTRDGLLVEPSLASFVIDPEPVWGDLVLDAHIIALPAITPTPADVSVPSPVPTVTATPG